ncbi:hypothetical protein OX283_009510 [Flavobacterium sp. SUN052]|uniref:hypothetical protein n=1 Tax=Flavobacterium sp. SUN052 TaxID=3002441 RepID=UPI00237D4409|nr:hypothetical protein [Flavobacterium sp. SUN052]MEC4004891.1 hypothetical protein [Flavobacterium sp. SUN052]
MKKIILLSIITLFTLNLEAQEKKTKTTEQSRSAVTGRYVTKKEATNNPNTTYTSKKRR